MANPWIEFVKEYRIKHPKLSYKEALSKASKVYKKKKPVKDKGKKVVGKGKGKMLKGGSGRERVEKRKKGKITPHLTQDEFDEIIDEWRQEQESKRVKAIKHNISVPESS